MGFLDDMEKVFSLGKGIAREAMGEKNTCAQVTLACPCGLEQVFPLNIYTPEELTEEIRKHATTCDKAKGS